MRAIRKRTLSLMQKMSQNSYSYWDQTQGGDCRACLASVSSRYVFKNKSLFKFFFTRFRWRIRAFIRLSKDTAEVFLARLCRIYKCITNVKKPLSSPTIYLRVSVQNLEVYLKNSYHCFYMSKNVFCSAKSAFLNLRNVAQSLNILSPHNKFKLCWRASLSFLPFWETGM